MLAALKIPCAINTLINTLSAVGRTRDAWLTAIAAAITKFGADAQKEEISIRMDPQYRAHRANCTSRRESSANLPWLQKKLHQMTDADFDTLMQWDPAWTSDIDDVAVLIKEGPFDVKALSIYKPKHMVRTITTMEGLILPIVDDATDRNFLRMSAKVNDCRKRFYSSTVSTPAEAVQWIECGIRHEAIRLGLSSTETNSLVSSLEISSMTRGDEAYLMCEIGRFISGGLPAEVDRILEMETVIRFGIDWRHSMYGSWEGGAIEETEESGQFVNGKKALNALPYRLAKAICEEEVTCYYCKVPNQNQIQQPSAACSFARSQSQLT